MAVPNKDFLIRVQADIAKAINDLKLVEKQLGQTGAAGKKAGGNGGLGGYTTSLRGAAAAAGVYLALRVGNKILNEADAWNILQDRIRTATKATGDYSEVLARVLTTSVRNGTQLRTTVALFQNLARSAPELNASNKEILELTNAVQQLGILSGALPQNMNAGLLQFSQGLASNVFRAEEFNSILENIPELAVRIAAGMDTTVGKLRLAIIRGEVLSKDVFESIKSQIHDINREAEDLPNRLARAKVAFFEALKARGGVIDEGIGLSSGFADLLQGAAEVIAPQTAQLQQPRLLEKRKRILEAIARTEAEIQALRNSDDRESQIFRYTAEQRLVSLRKEDAEVGQRILEGYRAIAQENAKLGAKQGKDTSGEPTKEQIALAEKIATATKKLQEQAATLGATNEQAAIYATTLGDLKGALDEDKQSIIAAARALDEKKAAADREKEISDHRAKDTELVQTLTQEAQALRLSGREQAQFAAAARLSADATEAQRQRVIELAGSLYDLQEQSRLAADLSRARARLATLQGGDLDASKTAIITEYKDLIERLKAVGDTEGAEVVKKLIGVEKVSAEFEALETEYRRAIDKLSNQTQRIQVEKDAGLISEMEARKQIVALQQAAADQLGSDVLPKMAELAKTLGPDSVATVERFRVELTRMGLTANETFRQIKAGVEQGLTQSFEDLLNGTKSLSEAFKAFGDVVIQTVNRIIAEALTDQLITFFTNLFGPTKQTGGTTDASTGHSGGMIGGAMPGSRRVASSTFAGAPRFHSGGLLAPDEVPVIARRGEGIFTPAQMRALAPVGAGGDVKVEVNNYSREPARVERSQGQDGQKLIRVIVGEVANDISRGGQVARAMETSYGARRVGR